jgi:drug/metabolite transporter (DMT)-like permease
MMGAMGAPQNTRRLAADAALLAVAAAWGLTFPLGKIVLTALPPFTYLTMRFSLASIALLLLSSKPRRVSAAASMSLGPLWTQALAVGVVFFFGYAFQVLGLRMTTASQAGFITGTSVIMVPVISGLWLRRVPRPLVLAGIAAATVGLGLLALEGPMAVRMGDLLVLACAVCFAVHIVLVGRLAPALDHRVFAVAQAIPVAVLGAIGALTEHPGAAIASAGLGIWAAIAFMAVTASAGALLVQSWAQRFTTPSHTGLMFTFEPVAAALLAYAMLGEALTARQALGAVLILLGIVIAEIRPTARSL